MAKFLSVMATSDVTSLKKYLVRGARRNIIRMNNFVLKVRNTPQEVVWIVGDGRSGTTWLAELINHNNDFRYMFEPFHRENVDGMEDISFLEYHPPDQSDERFYTISRRVFSGELINDRVDMFNTSLVYDKLLIKDIFAGLFVSWVGVNFPDIRKIMLLRHPCAVAMSKSRNDEMIWLTDARELFGQPVLFEKYLAPYTYLLEEIDTPFDHYLLVWAIVHYVSLQEFDAQSTKLVFYEELCLNTTETISSIFSYLDMPDAGERRIGRMSSKGSKTAGSKAVDKSSAVGGWRRALTPVQKNKADRILGAFGLDKIYSSNSDVPDVAAAMHFIKKTRAAH